MTDDYQDSLYNVLEIINACIDAYRFEIFVK